MSLADQPHSNDFQQLSMEAQQRSGLGAGRSLRRQNTAVKTAIQAAREPRVRGPVPACGPVPFLGAETLARSSSRVLPHPSPPPVHIKSCHYQGQAGGWWHLGSWDSLVHQRGRCPNFVAEATPHGRSLTARWVRAEV